MTICSMPLTLNHEIFDGPMKYCVVVVAFLGQFYEIFTSFGNIIAMELQVEGAFVGHYSHVTLLLDALIPK